MSNSRSVAGASYQNPSGRTPMSEYRGLRCFLGSISLWVSAVRPPTFAGTEPLLTLRRLYQTKHTKYCDLRQPKTEDTSGDSLQTTPTIHSGHDLVQNISHFATTPLRHGSVSSALVLPNNLLHTTPSVIRDPRDLV